MAEDTQKQTPAVVFNNQYIKDLSLEIPFAPEIFREIKEAPKVNIDVDINAKNLGESYYNVDLHITINGDINEKKLFVLELTYSSVVNINVPEEHLEPVLLIEVPRLLFPFARNVVTQCLTEGGLPPFMINPIDFGAIYAAKKLKETTKESEKKSN